jgi:anti-sigma regulatory factor (Ser/Thr protein kinase)
LELVNAGHPPALVVDPSGEAHFLWPKGGVPLGATAAATYEAERFPLPTGATVLIYTDGLVERRGESIEVGLERLREIAKGARDPESLCVTICERLVPEEPEDDVAFIATRLPPLGDHLTTSWRVSPDSLAPVRYLLRRWLMSRGANEQQTYDVIVATQEACANAVEHAYAPGPAGFELEAEHAAGEICLTVRDRGHWRDARGVHRGRGLPIMEALMDTVDIQHSPVGTAVQMRRALGARETG